jgi:ubiquinone/menaquinone biosynthesis C-methylase UbiE
MIYTSSHHITPDFFVQKIEADFKNRIGEPFDKYYEKGHTYRPFDFASVLFNTKFSKDDVILDLGGACSYYSIFLSDIVSKIYIVDNFTFAACKVWEDTLHEFPEFANGKISLIKSSGIDLLFKDNSIDHVITFSVLEHCINDEDTRSVLEIERVLKSGGTFSGTVDFNPATEYPLPIEHPTVRMYTYKSLMDRIINVSGLKLAGGDYEQYREVPEKVDYVGCEIFFKLIKAN